MSHLIKVYAFCKFSYFRLWYLKGYNATMPTTLLQDIKYHPNHKTEESKFEWVNSGLTSHQQRGHTETGPRFKVSSERPEKRGIDLATPGLVVQRVIHYTTAAPPKFDKYVTE